MIPAELVLDAQLLQANALFLLLSEKTPDARCFLRVGSLFIFLIAEFELGRHEFPRAIAVLEGLSVYFIKCVALQLAAKEYVAIHGLSCHVGDLLIIELKEGVASRAGGLLGARDAELSDWAELLEEALELLLIEALRKVTHIDDSLRREIACLHSEFVEPTSDF